MCGRVSVESVIGELRCEGLVLLATLCGSNRKGVLRTHHDQSLDVYSYTPAGSRCSNVHRRLPSCSASFLELLTDHGHKYASSIAARCCYSEQFMNGHVIPLEPYHQIFCSFFDMLRLLLLDRLRPIQIFISLRYTSLLAAVLRHSQDILKSDGSNPVITVAYTSAYG